MLNDTIISGLVNLFALLGARNGVEVDRSERKLRDYLANHFGLRDPEEYISLYNDLRSVYDLDSKTDRSDVVTGICSKIKNYVSGNELSMVLLRLMEFVAVVDDPIFLQIASEFNVPDSLLADFKDFVSGKETGRVFEQQFPGYSGKVRTLWIPSAGNLVFSYKGEDEVLFNDVPLSYDSFRIWEKSGVLKSRRGNPVHWSTAHKPYEDNSLCSIDFIGRNLEFRYPGSDIGLHDMNFHLHGGELVAVMGGSGTGKTTLLSILNGSLKPSSGELFINGYQLNDPAVRSMLGFVPQDDLLIEELTVYENLYHTAKFCFDGMPEDELDRRVMRLLSDLELGFAKDLKVGSPLKKTISGGQRKRLNIALEIIREPSVLLLDEPTSGLSSVDSENIVGLLRRQADMGALVIANIHQPSSDIYKMFDRLWLMDKGGYPVYDGNPIDAVTWFKRAANYADPDTSTCPLCGNINPELILNIIDEKTIDNSGLPGKERKVSPQEWHALYLKGREVQPENPGKQPLPSNEQKKPGKFKQFAIYSVRNLRAKLTNMQYIMITLLEAPLLAVVCGLLTRYAPPSGYTVLDNKNLVSYMFMAVIVAVFLGMSSTAEEIIRDRAILKREKFLQLSYGSYIFSKISYAALISLIQTASFIIVGNLIMGLHGNFLLWWVILFTVSLVSALVGLLLSQLLDSVVAIYISIPILLVPQIMLCGLVVDFSDLNPDNAHGDVPVIGDFVPSRWAFEALAVGSFAYNDYEKDYFELDRESCSSLYYRDIVIEDMRDKLYRGKAEEIESVAEELPYLAEAAGIEPYTAAVGDSVLNEWLLRAERALVKSGNAATLQKDKLVSEAIKLNGYESVAASRLSHWNKKLEQLVSPNIWLSPKSRNGRAPFYSSEKIIGTLHIPTVFYNLIILLAMGIIMSILLVINIKSINFFKK